MTEMMRIQFDGIHVNSEKDDHNREYLVDQTITRIVPFVSQTLEGDANDTLVFVKGDEYGSEHASVSTRGNAWKEIHKWMRAVYDVAMDCFSTADDFATSFNGMIVVKLNDHGSILFGFREGRDCQSPCCYTLDICGISEEPC